MSLMRPFTSLREDLDRMFNELERGFMTPMRSRRRREAEEGLTTVFMPPVDVIDEENQVRIKAMVPGVRPEDLDIEIDSEMIAISGKTTEEEVTGNYYRSEVPRGQVFREIPLPTIVKPDQAHANFENGILTVTIPKSEEARRHRIKVGP